jgi:hypothetical protein
MSNVLDTWFRNGVCTIEFKLENEAQREFAVALASSMYRQPMPTVVPAGLIVQSASALPMDSSRKLTFLTLQRLLHASNFGQYPQLIAEAQNLIALDLDGRLDRTRSLAVLVSTYEEALENAPEEVKQAIQTVLNHLDKHN